MNAIALTTSAFNRCQSSFMIRATGNLIGTVATSTVVINPGNNVNPTLYLDGRIEGVGLRRPNRAGRFL